MTVFIRQIRSLISEVPLKGKKTESRQDIQRPPIRRKSLSVKISKEPPAIVYFERDKLEDSFECIFDPLVHHDEEKDHPDLFTDNNKKKDLKPWQKPPYCSSRNNHSASFFSRFKSTFNKTILPSNTPTGTVA